MEIGGARSVSGAGRSGASGGGGRRDGSSERVEARWWSGWLRPVRPSNGAGTRAGVLGASGSEGEQPVVGQRDAMGVAGEVGEDLLGTGKGRLAIHDPVLGGRAREPVARVLITPRGDRGASDGRLELGQELAAEDRGEDPHGQEE